MQGHRALLHRHPGPFGAPGPGLFPGEWPKEYRYDLLVAYHGSWNRTTPTGYKVVRYSWTGRQLPGGGGLHHRLAHPQGALGRPVDILITDDGEIYISDDKAGVIYRVVYKKM